MKHVIIDIDHTISDAFWRDGMIGGDGGWDAYHAASCNDKPLLHMPRLVECLARRYVLVGATARPEKWRQLTQEWLLEHQILLHELLMRPDDAFRPAPQIKVELIRARFKSPKDEIAFIIDDREDVISAFLAEGVPGFMAYGKCNR